MHRKQLSSSFDRICESSGSFDGIGVKKQEENKIIAQPAAQLQVIERFLHRFRTANFLKWPVEKRLLSIIWSKKKDARGKIK